MLTKRILFGALTAGACLMLASAQPALARYKKAEPLPAPAPVPMAATAADCCAAAAPCCPTPCITYRHRGPKLCCGCCQPPVSTVLKVKNPCTSCETDVPVCIPACCTGEPTVCCGSGLLGRDVVEYQWCCGYSVRVAFKHCGDLLVTTWGR